MLLPGPPTTYGNVNFRSRLEAEWGAMFDLLGWRWGYEPFDLAGWIPDFVLTGERQDVLVEVKPVCGIYDPLFKQTVAEIKRANPRQEVLIVSYYLPEDEDTGSLCVGWLGEHAKWGLVEPRRCLSGAWFLA